MTRSADHTDTAATETRTVALIGNPNVGKSTLFNTLAGRRQKTANFPGTTQEAHLASVDTDDGTLHLIDLPGAYALNLKLSESGICRGVLEGSIAPEGHRAAPPDAVAVVLDATNLPRNLRLAGEVLARRIPAVAVVTMIDDARRRGIHIDEATLAERLGIPVLLVSNKTGENVDRVADHLAHATPSSASIPETATELERWADDVYADTAAEHDQPEHDSLTDRLDRAFTHPVVGVLSFAAVMTGLFWVIYRLATYPMDWIDAIFATLGGAVASTLPAGPIASLLTDGVIAGVGGTVIFLPQIILLFFLIALLEQTGYLARAAFVIDRLLRPFGLPGHAFVPLLSGHACAIPAIMSARAIPDRRHRLTTILVIPFMSCSARIPVYVLLTALLFPGSPAMQALAFTACYALGIAAALLTAVLFRGTILKGKGRPMAMELPRYRAPDPIAATKLAISKGGLFLKKAGTVILAISVVLWWLNTYPSAPVSPEATELRQRAAQVAAADTDQAEALTAEADRVDAANAASHSFLGRIGSATQPLFEPVGADRQLTIGILASFAAREVFVATVAVQVAGTDDTEAEGVFDSITSATRDDGSPLFTAATSWSTLVFFVLAMQCFPTLVVTAREAGGWKWAGLQFAWMTAVAYAAAAITFAIAS